MSVANFIRKGRKCPNVRIVMNIVVAPRPSDKSVESLHLDIHIFFLFLNYPHGFFMDSTSGRHNRMVQVRQKLSKSQYQQRSIRM